MVSYKILTAAIAAFATTGASAKKVKCTLKSKTSILVAPSPESSGTILSSLETGAVTTSSSTETRSESTASTTSQVLSSSLASSSLAVSSTTPQLASSQQSTLSSPSISSKSTAPESDLVLPTSSPSTSSSPSIATSDIITASLTSYTSTTSEPILTLSTSSPSANSSPSTTTGVIATASLTSSTATTTTLEPSPSSPTSFLQNGGFESGTSSWQLTGGQVVETQDGLSGHGNSQHFYYMPSVPGVGFGPYLGQPMIGTKAGYTYYVNFWYASLGPSSNYNGGACTISVSAQNLYEHPVLRQNTPLGTWIASPQYTFSPYEDNSQFSISVMCSGGASGITMALDDITIVDSGLGQGPINSPAPPSDDFP